MATKKNNKSTYNNLLATDFYGFVELTPGDAKRLPGFLFSYNPYSGSNHQTAEKMVYKQIRGTKADALSIPVLATSKPKTSDLNNKGVTEKAYDEVKTLSSKGDGIRIAVFVLIYILYLYII